jgi:hypothetical protein
MQHRRKAARRFVKSNRNAIVDSLSVHDLSGNAHTHIAEACIYFADRRDVVFHPAIRFGRFEDSGEVRRIS